MESKKERLWEVDCARGLAVLMMVASNLLFDLYYFFGLPIDPDGPARWFAMAVAATFLAVAGISLTLRQRSGQPGQAGFSRFLRRGLRVFGLGFLVTAGTWFAAGDQMVLFGVLHCIGLSTILFYPLLHWRLAGLAAGLGCILIGWWLGTFSVSWWWLLWLGVRPEEFVSVDYIPLLPWSGFMLIGVFLGNTLFPGGKSPLGDAAMKKAPPVRAVAFLGRHSLLVYFAHQPLILGALLLLRRLDALLLLR